MLATQLRIANANGIITQHMQMSTADRSRAAHSPHALLFLPVAARGAWLCALCAAPPPHTHPDLRPVPAYRDFRRTHTCPLRVGVSPCICHAQLRAPLL
jgi:hypothetical protein